MRYLIALVAVLAFTRFAHATAQMPDKLVLDGEEVSLHTNPLQPYLHAHSGEVPEFPPMTTANWRGYIATFVIRDDLLIVDKVEVRDLAEDRPRAERDPHEEVRFELDLKDIITEVFDGRDDVPATWYTGALVIPRGERVHYVHMGYGSTYERYTLLDVQAGRVVERLDLDADEFTAHRRARFEAFKASPAYAGMLEQVMSDHPMEPAAAEEFLYQYTAEDYLSRDSD